MDYKHIEEIKRNAPQVYHFIRNQFRTMANTGLAICCCWARVDGALQALRDTGVISEPCYKALLQYYYAWYFSYKL